MAGETYSFKQARSAETGRCYKDEYVFAKTSARRARGRYRAL